MLKLRKYLAFSLSALAACSYHNNGNAQAEPAILSEYSEESLKLVSQTLAELLGKKSLTIRKDAFTQYSRFVLEPYTRPTMERQSTIVDEYSKPDVFLLSIQQGRCIITHENSQRSKTVDTLRCKVKE